MTPKPTKSPTPALALAPCSATIGVYVTLRGVRYRLQYASRDLAAQGIREARRQGGTDINVFDPWLPKTQGKPNVKDEPRP